MSVQHSSLLGQVQKGEYGVLYVASIGTCASYDTLHEDGNSYFGTDTGTVNLRF